MNMKDDFKRRMAHEAMIFCGILILLFFVLRLWPLVFLSAIVLFICIIRLLFLKPKPVVLEALPQQTEPERPETEQDILRRAFGVIQRRITEQLTGFYPDARWVWAKPNPMADIAEGNPVFILLNRAGGFKKAEVVICRLQFKTLRFETAADALPMPKTEPEAEAENEPEETNYGLLAFEWVEANSLMLNRLCNDAIANRDTDFLIPSEDLPAQESWQDICDELVHNGFAETTITPDGIRVSHTKNADTQMREKGNDQP
jgi:hypothetical protein